MPITRSDRISGTIYVIATDADDAQRLALDYLRDNSDDYHVYGNQKDADGALYNRYGSYDTDRDRVYAVSLDIRIADEK
ncbi:hypothetical protein [Streptomyces viridosporus]|nr:hypothetical protein [Streptomyces viridosporus]